MRRFLNAADAREIVFVRGATEAINLVAQSWGASLPQARRRGADQRARASLQHRAVAAAARAHRPQARGGADRRDRRARHGRVRGALLSPRTRLVAMTHLANATGALVPVETGSSSRARGTAPRC